MSVPPRLRTFELHGILLALTKLNVLDSDRLGSQLVRALAEHLSTDRVTHSIVNQRTGEVLASAYVGYSLPAGGEPRAGKLMMLALNEGAPLIFRDIRAEDTAAQRADDYRTDACAILPLEYGGIRIGVLCLSNLTEEQVAAMRMQPAELELFTSLAALLSAVILAHGARRGDKRMRKLLKGIAEE